MPSGQQWVDLDTMLTWGADEETPSRVFLALVSQNVAEKKTEEAAVSALLKTSSPQKCGGHAASEVIGSGPLKQKQDCCSGTFTVGAPSETQSGDKSEEVHGRNALQALIPVLSPQQTPCKQKP